jgi:hypothetical protein
MDHLAVTVRAPFEDTPRSISAPSCTASGINSTPNDGAADWMAANWRIPRAKRHPEGPRRANSQSRTDNLCKRCLRSRGPGNDRLPPARDELLQTAHLGRTTTMWRWAVGTQENSEEVHPKTDMTAYREKISGVRFH